MIAVNNSEPRRSQDRQTNPIDRAPQEKYRSLPGFPRQAADPSKTNRARVTFNLKISARFGSFRFGFVLFGSAWFGSVPFVSVWFGSDTSNGTYVDAVRVPKGTTVVFTAKSEVALYLPQSNVALGRPILYKVKLNPEAFEKVRWFSVCRVNMCL